MRTIRESLSGSTKRSVVRILMPGLVALGVFVTADTASGNEFLPDCSPSQSTNCIVSTELNGTPTTALKATVQVQSALDGGTNYQVFFTQPEPFSAQPIFLCSGGQPPLNLVDPDTGQPYLACPPGEDLLPPVFPECAIVFAGFGGVERCGDLTRVAPAGTKVGLTVNLGSAEPKAVIIRGGRLGGLTAPNKTWILDKTSNGNTLKLETVLGTSSFLAPRPSGPGPDPGFDPNPCSLFPVVKDCGGPTAVATWTGTFAVASLLPLDGTATGAFSSIAGGATIATNAQNNAPPIFDSATRTLSFQVAAPHFQSNGTSLNRGFVESYLPDSLLESNVGFGLPPDLSARELLAMLGMDKSTGSSVEAVTPTVTPAEGGAFYSVPDFGFSSPEFEYLRRKAAGAFTSKVTATKKKVSVTLEVSGKSTVSVAGKIGKKAICTGTKAASKAGSVTVSCKLSRPGKKLLGKAKKGSRVNVKVTLKAKKKKTQVKNTYGLIP